MFYKNLLYSSFTQVGSTKRYNSFLHMKTK